jgi:hypothetical protein
MNHINFPKSIRNSIKGKIEPKFQLVNGGSNMIINLGKDESNETKYKMLGIHNMSPIGILCDDLETFVKWEQLN